ncbi:MAG: HAMP domain-containing histidine kinase [Bacteroidales bacterium]|nr:HAMP domain-containing histidine kinase [Bacteroidales bacterium]
MEKNNLSHDELLNKINILTNENLSLNDEIGRLEITLVNINNRLEEAEALKSHFVSNISNEIVNPFTSILALAESILDVDKENWKKVVSMIALIHSEVFYLDFQLKNIFAAAKLEAGELQPEISTVDVNNLINNAIDTFKYETRHKGLTIEFIAENKNADTQIFFNTDSEKLNLILTNLLSNAIKFSKKDNKIIIKATRVFDKLMIEVKDFGIGISKENESIIFDRFKRIDSGINSINRGHGLGLSVNKAVLDLLDGTISFTSKPNEGATFIVHIPESKDISKGISTDANELFFKDENF